MKTRNDYITKVNITFEFLVVPDLKNQNLAYKIIMKQPFVSEMSVT